MARKVIWSDEAIADLADLVRHITADDPSAAERMGLRILDRTRILEAFPLTGRVVPEASDPSIREVIVDPYRVIYELDATGRMLAVLRVWHAARDRPGWRD
jgi:plasmid stabilization system protein ParE